jgi:hypothetical protein
MENLEQKLRELKEKGDELLRKAEEFDSSLLVDPNTPESIKEYIRSKREEEKKPEPFDGLIISNKIIGYDPDTFNPIYENNQ